jgi:hypothetical protein
VSIPSSGLKVLVIDDSNTIRRSAEIFLKQGGHEVLLAEDGFDALAKVNDYQPSSNATPGFLMSPSSCCHPKTVCSTRPEAAWSARKTI